MLMNMRRVISIIGYDPSSYFKGEGSLASLQGGGPDTTVKASADGNVVLSGGSSPPKRPMPAAQKMDKMQSLYRHTNLN